MSAGREHVKLFAQIIFALLFEVLKAGKEKYCRPFM